MGKTCGCGIMINVKICIYGLEKHSIFALEEYMGNKIVYALTKEQIEAINAVVNRGDRVEVVPVKDGLKLLETRRKVIKTEK